MSWKEQNTWHQKIWWMSRWTIETHRGSSNWLELCTTMVDSPSEWENFRSVFVETRNGQKLDSETSSNASPSQMISSILQCLDDCNVKKRDDNVFGRKSFFERYRHFNSFSALLGRKQIRRRQKGFHQNQEQTRMWKKGMEMKWCEPFTAWFLPSIPALCVWIDSLLCW